MAAGGALGAPIGVFLLHNADVRASAWRSARCSRSTASIASRRAIGARKASSGGLDAFAGLIGGALGGFAGIAGAGRRGLDAAQRREARRAARDGRGLRRRRARVALAVYASAGALDAGALRLFVVVAPTALISSYLGAGLTRRSRANALARAVPALVAAAGAALIIGVARTLSAAR